MPKPVPAKTHDIEYKCYYTLGQIDFGCYMYGTAQFKLDYTRVRQLYDSTCF